MKVNNFILNWSCGIKLHQINRIFNIKELFLFQKILILDLTRVHYMDQIAAKGFVSWAESKGEKQNHELNKSPLIYVIAPPDG